MIIQFNTDKNIEWNERHQTFFSSEIADDLRIYESHITRIEVHLKDENGKKEGVNDKNCLMEARVEGRQPIAVSNQADTIELAVAGATDKLKASLKKIIEQIQHH